MNNVTVHDDQTTTSYDEIPYESHAFPQSHPDRLATMGRLFGMQPAPVETCRVLELGCASGGNLIPMAFSLPRSEFVGVDFSRREVEAGRKVIADMALPNVRIEHASILDIDASWGEFDYVIAHGVFSWVPYLVQDKILAVCGENLRPQGIGYVSYNTYPGWHMREMIRHMMIYHSRQFSDTAQRITQARALIDFLARSTPAQDNFFGLLLKSELELIKKSKDYYLFHEHLEDENKPLYFHEFVERAETKGLQYLSEAEFGTMLTSGFPKEVADTLTRISKNIIRTEQYMDFLRNRLFRQTLVCRKGVPLKRNLDVGDIQGFLVASPAAPDKEAAEAAPGGRRTFRTPRGATVQTDRLLTQEALTALRAHWPRALTVDDLFDRALGGLKEHHGLSSTDGGAERRILLADLLQCYSAGVVELRTWQADFLREPGEHPRMSRLAAYQSAQGLPCVNLRHETIRLDAVARHIVPLLDGTRDRDTILAAMRSLVTNGTLVISRNKENVCDEELIQKTLTYALTQALTKMAAAALFV